MLELPKPFCYIFSDQTWICNYNITVVIFYFVLLYILHCSHARTQIIGKVGVGNAVGIIVTVLLLAAVIVSIVVALIYDSRKMKRHASWKESSSAPLDVENGNVVSDIFNGTVYEA